MRQAITASFHKLSSDSRKTTGYREYVMSEYTVPVIMKFAEQFSIAFVTTFEKMYSASFAFDAVLVPMTLTDSEQVLFANVFAAAATRDQTARTGSGSASVLRHSTGCEEQFRTETRPSSQLVARAIKLLVLILR